MLYEVITLRIQGQSKLIQYTVWRVLKPTLVGVVLGAMIARHQCNQPGFEGFADLLEGCQ